MAEETYYSNDTDRVIYAALTDDANSMIAGVSAKFPWVNKTDYSAVSSMVFHPVLNEHVVTAFMLLPVVTAMAGDQYGLGCRKFCMDSGTSFVRLYRLADTRPSWLPPSAKLLFVGENHDEIKRPAPAGIADFFDIYFSGDPAEVEAAFNLPQRRGKYETFYGATVRAGAPVRVKQYVYDEQNGLSDWDVIYLTFCKKMGIDPTSRELLVSPPG